MSADPDQFFFGGHIETGPLAEHVTFRPNVEIGVGNNVTALTINLELAYSVPLSGKPWRVYLGGGPALVVFSGEGPRPRGAEMTDVGGGFNVLMGAQHSRGLFTELKVGFVRSPELKFAVGYAFK